MMDEVHTARREYELLDNLRRLNRKERFYLLGWALDKPDFDLGSTFRSCLSHELDQGVREDAFVAMDYHLDCLYAALELSRSFQPVYKNLPAVLKGTHEDIDLLVAWQSGKVTHIAMVAAKGVMPFSNRQLNSKVDRLKGIFGKDGTAWPNVKPYFLIASPKESKHIITKDWPPWALRDGQPRWLELPLPDDLMWATRCDEAGAISHQGTWWKIQPDR